MRVRRNVAGLTLGSSEAAREQPWHPVLDAYARGVAAMRALDDAARPVPASWMWAANTHGIDQFTARRPAWAQCAHGSLFFLPWHRAYLAWFERTVRDAVDDDEWALPYWDPTDPDSDRTLPVEFTVEQRTVDGALVDNPLYSVRTDRPIPQADVEVVETLAQPRFVLEQEPGFGGALPDRFFGTVEDRPHNYVHMAIGGLMRSPATAGRDPVFWLHHANIDRLWEVWRALDGSVPITEPGEVPAQVRSAWDSATFWFGEEQRPSTYAMGSVEDLSSTQMDYRYESTALAPELADAVARRREEIVAAEWRGRGVEQASRWVPVGAAFDLPSQQEREIPFEAGPRGLDAPMPVRLLLELSGATATAPHDAYDVEVRATPDAPAHRVRGFSTFGLEGTPAGEVRNYLVDASAALPGLIGDGWAGGALTVQVVPVVDTGEGGESEERPRGVDDRAIEVAQVTVYVQMP